MNEMESLYGMARQIYLINDIPEGKLSQLGEKAIEGNVKNANRSAKMN